MKQSSYYKLKKCFELESEQKLLSFLNKKRKPDHILIPPINLKKLYDENHESQESATIEKNDKYRIESKHFYCNKYTKSELKETSQTLNGKPNLVFNSQRNFEKLNKRLKSIIRNQKEEFNNQIELTKLNCFSLYEDLINTQRKINESNQCKITVLEKNLEEMTNELKLSKEYILKLKANFNDQIMEKIREKESALNELKTSLAVSELNGFQIVELPSNYSNKSLNSDIVLCIICLERLRSIVFSKCKHFVYCKICLDNLLRRSKQLKIRELNCPVCSSKSSRFEKIIIA